MNAWHEELKDWEGTAEALVARVGRLVGEDVPADEFAPNVRLLRHYQSIGAVSKPERRGKEAIYGYRQLLEVMVVRTMVLDGWPLAKIAEMTSAATEDELVAMLPARGPGGGSPRNAAQELVSRYVRKSGQASTRGPRAEDMDVDYSIVPEVARASMRFRGDEDGTPDIRELIELEPAPGIRVSVDRRELQRLGAREIRALGDAVERALTDARRRVRGGKDDD